MTPVFLIVIIPAMVSGWDRNQPPDPVDMRWVMLALALGCGVLAFFLIFAGRFV